MRFTPISGFLTTVVVVTGSIIFSQCTTDVYYEGVCFSGDVKPIFTTNCSMPGCHNPVDQANGYDFSTYEGIMEGIEPGNPWDSKIFEAITADGDDQMPPTHKLSAKEINTIKGWVKAGAKNDTTCATGCDTAVFTYSQGVNPIIERNCRGCHNNTLQSGGINLETHQDIVTVQGFGGMFLGVIRHDNGFNPMPYNQPKMPPCEVRVVEKWVNAGMPNN
jgi:hypothetical protein